MTISIDDFEAFHRAVHGCDPFDWQSRLLREVVARRGWPRVLDLPTGSGKTTCIDIAVFALALDASKPCGERWCPRRVAMVVDRRIVVDQAAERGRKLLHVLTTAAEAVPRAVRDALVSLTGGSEEPLGVFTLRGGIPNDDGWARAPDQPLVIASTVDQIGSRLLVRGYGVSRGMRPVHAGLAGNDMLLLLDEVHLSHPFKQTLERLLELRARFDAPGLPRRFQCAFLSATPGEVREEPFRLMPAEMTTNAPLGPRLHARKPTSIAKVVGREALAARVATEAFGLLSRHTVIAAVVNRVDTALEVFAILKRTLGSGLVLLTGRMRPLDRDEVLRSLLPRIVTGLRTRAANEPKLVVVGTQCIEAGADFDFDAMVSESASFDGLRQRFGRVDRLGVYRDASGQGMAEGVIVHDKTENRDPIYDDAIAATVKWLEERRDKTSKTVDFGSRSLLDAPPSLLTPKPNAPTLLPAYLDLWSQTSPEPAAVPEPGLFLHGPRSGPEDVQVIWRTDIDESSLTKQNLSCAVAAVGAVPPSSLEAISLPFIAARRWLADATRADALRGRADLELQTEDGELPERLEPKPGASRRALRWRGDRSELVIAPSGPFGVRPGDTLVVPSTYGGIDRDSRCFDPAAVESVPDLAERASLVGRGRPVLRLHPRVLSGLDLRVDEDDAQLARAMLEGASSKLDDWRRIWAACVATGRKVNHVPWYDDTLEGWTVLEGKRVSARVLREVLAPRERIGASIEDGVQSTTDDEDSPYLGAAVRLDIHSRDVESLARDYAHRLGLSKELVDDLALAAWLHDIGKADTRFQRMLRGGSEIGYYRNQNEILAKSAMPKHSRLEQRKAQRLSGYPRGARHEVQSLAMIEGAREQVAARAHDLELVMHLVASHHGHCRPFAPPVEDSNPIGVELLAHKSERFGSISFGATSSANLYHRLDSALADRFWSLNARYGWLELCWLETILRLADHRASELEAELVQ